MRALHRRQVGFTLIEIAIVLVVIGFMLGGILKGQELITSARVRNIISQQDGIRAAYFGFLDRYRTLPGDFSQATMSIPGVAAGACPGNGNGDGRIDDGAGSVEFIMVWEHLSKAGFINGAYTCALAESSTTTPSNPYAVRLRLAWDSVYDPAGGPGRHNLKTGSQVPSDILAEVDRKIDDGVASGGSFRFSAHDGGAGAPVGSGTCYLAAAPNTWISDTSVSNCGGTSLF